MSGSEFPRVVVVVTGRTISRRGRVKWPPAMWEGTDDRGNPGGPGVFICRMCTAGGMGGSGGVNFSSLTTN
jgi:hypothetical protein